MYIVEHHRAQASKAKERKAKQLQRGRHETVVWYNESALMLHTNESKGGRHKRCRNDTGYEGLGLGGLPQTCRRIPTAAVPGKTFELAGFS